MQNASVIFRDIIMNCNDQYANLTYTLTNGNVHNSLLNATITFFVDLDKLQLQLKIDEPSSIDDHNYQKSFFRTSLDIGRLISGVQGNFITRMFLQSILSSIKTIPTFPFKKVR